MEFAAAPMKNVTLPPADLADLRRAKSLLENPGFAMRLANILGSPIEKGFKLLPKGWTAVVHKSVHGALHRGLDLALSTMWFKRRTRPASDFAHKVAVGASGGLGGAIGLFALPVELPFATTLMLRSIADIARSEGHDLRDIESRLACLEVFALGGRSKSDDAAENAYWAVRTLLAQSVSEAAAYVAQQGVARESAPALVRLISLIGSRFGVVVSEQVAAKAVPVVGAAAGSVINVLFMNHFQRMARGHFIVRRLENVHGQTIVREVYRELLLPSR